MKAIKDAVNVLSVFFESFKIIDIKDPCEKAQVIAVRRYPSLIRRIENPSEAAQMAAVKGDENLIEHIENPTELVQIYIIDNCRWLTCYIKDATEAVQLRLVSINTDYINQIKNPSETVQLKAIRHSPSSIKLIENPTETVQLEAIRRSPYVIDYIKNPTEKVQLAIVKRHASNIECIKDPTETARLAAVKQDGLVLEYVKKQTEAVQLAAVKQNGSAARYLENPTIAVQMFVAKHDCRNIHLIKKLDESVQKFIIEQAPSNIKYITNPIESVQLAVLDANIENLKYIKNPTEEAKLFFAKQHKNYIRYIKIQTKKIAIIGAGPVGLFTAIELNKNSGHYEITLFDKREAYTRNQIFLIEPKFYTRLPEILFDKLLKSYIDNPFITQDCYSYRPDFTRLISCRISDFEKACKEYLKKSSYVKFVTENIKSERLEKITKEFDLVIGSDGPESVLSSYLNFEKFYYKELESYGAGVIFEFKERPTKRETFYLQNLFRGFLTLDNSGYIGITLNESLRNTSKKEIDRLVQLAFDYYGLENTKIKNIFPINVKPYYRKQVITIDKFIPKESVAVLLGDAAFSPHFFTGSGVNFGFEMAVAFVNEYIKHKDQKQLKKEFEKVYFGVVATNLRRINNIVLSHSDLICNAFDLNSLKNFLEPERFREKFLKNALERDLCRLLYNDFILNQ